MGHSLFIHSSVDGHFGRFYLLTVVSNAAMNMGVQISLQDPAFNSFAEVRLLVECFSFVFHRKTHMELRFMGQATEASLARRGV